MSEPQPPHSVAIVAVVETGVLQICRDSQGSVYFQVAGLVFISVRAVSIRGWFMSVGGAVATLGLVHQPSAQFLCRGAHLVCGLALWFRVQPLFVVVR